MLVPKSGIRLDEQNCEREKIRLTRYRRLSKKKYVDLLLVLRYDFRDFHILFSENSLRLRVS